MRVATFWTTVAPALEGARGPVFHLCQGYEGSFSFYARPARRDRGGLPRPDPQARGISDARRRLETLGFGPVDERRAGVRASGFFPRGEPAAAAGRPRVLLVGPYEADVKGIASRSTGLPSGESAGARSGFGASRRTRPGRRRRRRGLVDEYHHRLPPDRMPFAYRASDLLLGPARPEEGFGLPVARGARLRPSVPALRYAGASRDRRRRRPVLSRRRPRSPGRRPSLRCGQGGARAGRVEGPRRATRFDAARLPRSSSRPSERALAGNGGPAA